jgi:3'-5' exonuclease
MYSGRANAPLDDMAQLCGFPGKLGMDGSKVWQAYLNGEVKAIRDYCETDVANTHLVYLRFLKMRGHLNEDGYQSEIQLVRDTLAAYPGEHWQQFMAVWDAMDSTV